MKTDYRMFKVPLTPTQQRTTIVSQLTGAFSKRR